jgi:hypothetical protein
MKKIKSLSNRISHQARETNKATTHLDLCKYDGENAPTFLRAGAQLADAQAKLDTLKQERLKMALMKIREDTSGAVASCDAAIVSLRGALASLGALSSIAHDLGDAQQVHDLDVFIKDQCTKALFAIDLSGQMMGEVTSAKKAALVNQLQGAGFALSKGRDYE